MGYLLVRRCELIVRQAYRWMLAELVLNKSAALDLESKRKAREDGAFP